MRDIIVNAHEHALKEITSKEREHFNYSIEGAIKLT